MNGDHTKPREALSEDLVVRLGDESYCTSSDVWALRREAAKEIERLRAHVLRRRDTLSTELEAALEDWKDADAPVERVVIAIGNLVQQGIDFVIAEFDEGEKA